MGNSWIAPTLLIGMATHSCVAFVPTFLGGVSHPAITSSNTIDASTSGGIGLGSHVSRSTHSRCTLRWRAGNAGPLMMAKDRKKGKGKAGRVELIERCAIEGIAGEHLSGTGSEIMYVCMSLYRFLYNRCQVQHVTCKMSSTYR